MSDKLAQQFAHRLFDAQAELAMVERDIALSVARRDALVQYIAASEQIAEQLSTRRSTLSASAIRIGRSLQDGRAAFLDQLTPEATPAPEAAYVSTPLDAGPAGERSSKARSARRASKSHGLPERQVAKPRSRDAQRPGGRRSAAREEGAPSGEERPVPPSLNRAEKTVLDILRDQPKLLGISDITAEVGVRLQSKEMTPPLRAVLQSLQRGGLVERVGHKWRTTQRDGILDAVFTR